MNLLHLHTRSLWPVAVALGLVLLVDTARGQRSFEAVGDSLYAHFENVGALEAYSKAGGDAPSLSVMFKTAVAANEIAQDLEAEGKRDVAEAMYRKAIGHAEHLRDAYPDRAESWFILAATSGKMAQFSGGKEKVRIGRAVEEFYTRSISLDSSYALAYMVAGIFNREVAQLSWIQKLAAKALFGGVPDGSLEQSRAYLEKALELDKTLLIAHFELAQTYMALGQRDKADSHLRFLRVLSPRSSEEVRVKRKAAKILASPETNNDEL
ncbi:MAG: hypothetical protein HKN13_02455 [Rhodothermales bacterium]|nr:hypothetical protein [Rhodothermales bacterium]